MQYELDEQPNAQLLQLQQLVVLRLTQLRGVDDGQDPHLKLGLVEQDVGIQGVGIYEALQIEQDVAPEPMRRYLVQGLDDVHCVIRHNLGMFILCGCMI